MAEEKEEEEEEEPSSSSSPPPKSELWPEAEAMNLLSAVLEISQEPAGDYDPRIDLYDRIRGKLAAKKSLTDQQILAQIRDIRASFEDRCSRIFNGEVVQRTESKVFVLSEKIWGDDMKLKLDQMKKPTPKLMTDEEEEMKEEEPKPNEEETQKADAAQR